MKWQVTRSEKHYTLVLPSKISIQDAVNFFKDLTELDWQNCRIDIDARQVEILHTAILQILYAFCRSGADCAVVAESENFCALEGRIGFAFPRRVLSA